MSKFFKMIMLTSFLATQSFALTVEEAIEIEFKNRWEEILKSHPELKEKYSLKTNSPFENKFQIGLDREFWKLNDANGDISDGNNAKIVEQALSLSHFHAEFYMDAQLYKRKHLWFEKVKIGKANSGILPFRGKTHLELQGKKLILHLGSNTLTSYELRKQWNSGKINLSQLEGIKAWFANKKIKKYWYFLNPVSPIRMSIRNLFLNAFDQILPLLKNVTQSTSGNGNDIKFQFKKLVDISLLGPEKSRSLLAKIENSSEKDLLINFNRLSNMIENPDSYDFDNLINSFLNYVIESSSQEYSDQDRAEIRINLAPVVVENMKNIFVGVGGSTKQAFDYMLNKKPDVSGTSMSRNIRFPNLTFNFGFMFAGSFRDNVDVHTALNFASTKKILAGLLLETFDYQESSCMKLFSFI